MSVSSPPPGSAADARLPVIDTRAALERMAGDEQLFRELARFFLEDSPVLLADVQNALAGRDCEAAARPAHSLKGIAANLGGMRLEAAARAVEELAVAGRVDPARTAAEQLVSEVERLSQALRSNVLD
jgi:HPt (histidine-containing phosphotransfer) domain-containing protein